MTPNASCGHSSQQTRIRQQRDSYYRAFERPDGGKKNKKKGQPQINADNPDQILNR
jgi:hypothetical protein